MNNRHTQDSAHSNCQTISINVEEHATWLTHFPIKTARLQKDQFESLMFLFFSVCIYLCERGRKKEKAWENKARRQEKRDAGKVDVFEDVTRDWERKMARIKAEWHTGKASLPSLKGMEVTCGHFERFSGAGWCNVDTGQRVAPPSVC